MTADCVYHDEPESEARVTDMLLFDRDACDAGDHLIHNREPTLDVIRLTNSVPYGKELPKR